MSNISNANSQLRAITELNKSQIIKVFRLYADNTHYVGESDFSTEYGIMLDYGKYGYSVHESYQLDDLRMLYRACRKFNLDHEGIYVAYPEESDKFNSVYIMDMSQLSRHDEILKEIRQIEGFRPFVTAVSIIDKMNK